jgi:hypothetical protein
MPWRNGGVIGQRNLPTQPAASGVWRLSELESARRGDSWPVMQSDPLWGSVAVLMHFNGANGSTVFTDSSSNALAVPGLLGAQISTVQSQFGGSSLYLDGTGAHLLTAVTSVLNIGGGDFTIEFFVRLGTGGGLNGHIVQIGTSDAARFTIYAASRSSIVLFTPSANRITRTGISTNVWYHVAVVRVLATNTTSMYVDGVRAGTYTGGISISGNSQMALGRNPNDSLSANFLDGYIDELRITKAARYSGATMTVPFLPFPDGP